MNVLALFGVIWLAATLANWKPARRKAAPRRSGGPSVVGWLFGSDEPEHHHRTRYKAGSRMAEIHARHLERVERERQEKADRKAERDEARRARQAEEAERKALRRTEKDGAGDIGVLARLESGSIGGNELRDLMASGQLRVKRNPAPLTDADRDALAKAEQMAAEFHGAEGYRQIIELSESERALPRFAVALGAMPEIEYEPGRGSQRAGWIWQHAAGDRGLLAKKARQKPVLAADPISRRPIIVPMRSPVRFEADKGLVG